MARLKQAYYGSCFVASCMHLQLKKNWPIHYKKGPSNFSDMAHGPIRAQNTRRKIHVALLIMARLKQAYYGSCFVASCMHLQLKKNWPIHYKKGPSNFSDMAHGPIRAQNTRRHAAFWRAAAVTCREALKMCGRCAARLAAMPWLSKYFEMGGKVHVKLTTNHNIYFHFYMHDASAPPKFACIQISQLHELIARWQRKRLSPPGDQNMHASSYLARHGNCAAL